MNLSPSPLSLSEYRLILRHDLMSFIQIAFHELNPQTTFVCGLHLELIATKLEACRCGDIRRLIINLPPRSLKSHCVSIAFVAYLLGHNPAAEVVCSSYGQDLADKLARDTRTIMQSTWYRALFSTRITERQAAHDFTTNGMGGRMATSVGGVLTGRGGDFIILDDPLKPEEALSETQRSGVNEWYNNTLVSRLNDKGRGCIIIVMQRLHQDDLVGHVLQQDNWEMISFPAIAESNEVHVIESPLGRRDWRRSPGDLLHPQRESAVILEEIKRRTGEYNFAAQYQQNPTPTGGAIVKKDWLKYYEPGSRPARFRWVVQSWDTANKAGELNDYSACTTWGVNGQDIYLLNVLRKKVNFADLKRFVIELRSRFRPHTVLIEDKASGTALIQELRGIFTGVKPYLPPSSTDKLMRLHAQAIYFENGRVFLPREAPWLKEYVDEITGFPGTKYDDQVDSTTQFLDYLRNQRPPMVISEEALKLASIPGPWTRHRWPL